MSFLQLKKRISEIISLNQEDHELIETFFIPRKVEKNVSSIAGRVTFPYQSVYHASKWAIEGLSERFKFSGIRDWLLRTNGSYTRTLCGTIHHCATD